MTSTTIIMIGFRKRFAAALPLVVVRSCDLVRARAMAYIFRRSISLAELLHYLVELARPRDLQEDLLQRGAWKAGLRPEIGHVSIRHDLALVHDGDLVAERLGALEAVGAEEHRYPLGPQVPQA